MSCLPFMKKIFFLPSRFCHQGDGAGAEVGRLPHSGDGEEQEGLHRAHGAVAGGERGGAAERGAGPGLLRGTHTNTCTLSHSHRQRSTHTANFAQTLILRFPSLSLSRLSVRLRVLPGGRLPAGVCVRCQGAGAGDRWHSRDRPE